MLVKSRRDEAPFWKSIDTGNNKKKIRQSFEDDADSVLEMRHFRERESKKSLIKFAVRRVTLSSVLASRKMDVALLNGLLIHSLVP